MTPVTVVYIFFFAAAFHFLWSLHGTLESFRFKDEERVRVRVRDFPNTKYCTRVNQSHFGGKKK